MSIPIRNYPYTDYHDLNLDWLLRNWTIFQADLEELKRRVKALEDWREVAEPDINTLKSQMTQVMNNILLLQNRVTTVENNINILSDDIKSFYLILTQSPDTLTVRAGSPNGPVIDLNNEDNFNALVNRIKNDTLPAKGYYNAKFYLMDSAILIRELSVLYEAGGTNTITLCYTKPGNSRSINTHILTLRYVNDTFTYTYNMFNSNTVDANEQITVEPSALVASGDADYPYMLEVNDSKVSNSSTIDVFFTSLNSFKTYSPIISEYVKTNVNSFTLYFTEVPGSSFWLSYNITGGM